MAKKQIVFHIELDEDKFPSSIEWEATDAGFDGPQLCESLMVYLWNARDKNTLSFDLWTGDMLVDDMNRYFFDTMMKMADTYQRATDAEDVSEMIKEFAVKFAKKVELVDEVDMENSQDEVS